MNEEPTVTDEFLINRCIREFENHWETKGIPAVSDFIKTLKPNLQLRAAVQLVSIDKKFRDQKGLQVSWSTYENLPEDVLDSIKSQVSLDQPTVVGEANCDRDENRPKCNNSFELRQDQKNLSHSADRFQIDSLHAAGGLGEVYVAYDKELDRKVALKRIKTEWADDEVARQRFSLESYVTGSLEHPGIVPVYSAGESGNGSPYYAMRFVRGKNLKEGIDELHKSRNPKSTFFYSLEFRNLLNSFVNACNTFAYAHSKGVLHRDIKPSNIMLGRYGETLVVDWGLAKKIDQPDRFPSYLVDDTSMMSAIGDHGSSATMQGSTIGTPAFMSPEQAAGLLDQMNYRSDIYSLGSTLYMLLTNRPPYSGRNGLEVVDKVRLGEFPKPRELDAGIPAALEAICLKAMSHRAENRYGSATHLANDLQRFLADGTVDAYSETWLSKLGRWLRLNRGVAFALTTGLIGIAIASLISSVIFNAERNRTKKALVRESKAKLEAELALDAEKSAKKQTKSVLDNVVSGSMAKLLSRNENLNDSEISLLRSMVNDFKDVITSPDISKFEKSSALSKLAFFQHRLGLDSEAHENASAAVATLQAEMDNGNTEDLQLQVGLAQSLAVKGILLEDNDRSTEAIECCKKAESIWKQLSESTNAKKYQLELANILVSKGNSYQNIGNKIQAMLSYQTANEIYESLAVSSYAGLNELQVVNARHNLATLMSKDTATIDTAIKIFKNCKDSLQGSLATSDDPEMTNYTNQIVNNLANCYFTTKKFREAALEFGSAIESQKQLVETWPLNRSYRKELATSLLGLGKSHTELVHPNAEGNLISAIEILKRLSQESSAFKNQYANGLQALGRLYKETDISKSRSNLSAARIVKYSLLESNPDNVSKLNQFLATEINWANSVRKQKKYEAALPIYANVKDYIDQKGSTKLEPEIVRMGLFGYADCLTKLKKWDEAEKVWKKLSSKLSDPAARIFELQRAICLTRLGKLSEGTELADLLLDSKKTRPVDYYDVACCFAIAAEFLVENNSKKENTEHDANWFRKKAMLRLQSAADDGLFQDERLKKMLAEDEDLDSLRQLDKFVEFVEKFSAISNDD